MLDRETADLAKKRRPEVWPQENGHRIARETGWFAGENQLIDAIRQEVAKQLTREQQDAGGFEVFTTFDLSLQAAAEQAVEKHLRQLEQLDGYPHPAFAGFQRRLETNPSLHPDYLQAAVSVIENDSGAIRAMVGGRDFAHSHFNRATQGSRQIGSILKPLVYATAFETGLFPGTFVSDNPIRPAEIAWNANDWSPKNSDGQYLGLQPAQRGLIESRNTMSVRVGERAGIDMVLAMIGHAGIAQPSKSNRTPQVYIGNLGATLQGLVSAYGTNRSSWNASGTGREKRCFSGTPATIGWYPKALPG
jgi:penicillin-binding protein 1A